MIKRIGDFPVSKDGYECGHGVKLWHPDSEDVPLEIVNTQVDMNALDLWYLEHPQITAPKWVAYAMQEDNVVGRPEVYIYPVEECYACP